MDVHTVTNGTRHLIAGKPDTPLLRTPEDAVGLLEICFAEQVRAVLLYAENLPARFFDLSSGEAGAMLQKLRNYHIKLAVVAAPAMPLSPHFRALMIEEQRGDDFRMFADAPTAAAWLYQE